MRDFKLTSVMIFCLLGAGLAPLPAHAQVSPVGAHHATRGPGALAGGVSPVGTYSAEVPLELPAPRGDVPVPLSVVYTGSARVGDAGTGWSVPLSYVRVSSSISRRKPMAPWIDRFLPPERVFLAIGGSPVLMFPGDEPGLYRPFASDSYLDLRAQGVHWIARDAAGRTYRFSRASALHAGVGDDTLWLLTEIHDLAGRDRVRVSYRIEASGCHAGVPEIMISDLHYTFDPDGTRSLYRVSVVPRTWQPPEPGGPVCEGGERAGGAILDRSMDEGYAYARTHIIDRIEIEALDNRNMQSWPSLVRSYQFAYHADSDSGAPRLVAVDVTGAGDHAGSTLPVARYQYGAATIHDQQKARLYFGGWAEVPRPVAVLPPLARRTMASSRSTTSTLVENPFAPDHLQLRFDVETVTAEHLVRDMTGDGLPDLLWKNGSRRYLVPNVTSWDGTRLDDLARLVELPGGIEFSRETITTPQAETLPRLDRNRRAVVHETWVQLIDWNGDGRLDILDARGKNKDHWKLYINRPGSTPHDIDWMEVHVNVSGLRQWINDRYGDDGVSGPLPLSRSKTIPNRRAEYCQEWRYVLVGSSLELKGPFDCGVKEEHLSTDTVTEWTVADLNGDGYPDVVVNSHPVLVSEPEWPDCDADGFSPPEEIESGRYQSWCVDQTRLVLPEENELHAFYNRAGAVFLDVFAASQPVFDPTSRRLYVPDASCGVEWWRAGGADAVGWPNHIRKGDSYQRCGFADVNGDGIADYAGYLGDGAGGFHTYIGKAESAFQNDWHEACRLENLGSGELYYSTRQTRGLVDLTGDGIPDLVEYHGVYPTGRWTVRPGTGAGFAPPISISAAHGFELSLARGRCGSDAELVAGILDVNGDGRPEAVRLSGERMMASPIYGGDGRRHAWSAGRLTAIENGYGAVERIEYTSAKNDTRSRHQVPFPEIVVSETRVDVDGGHGTPLAPTVHAYGGASLHYDPLLSRWSFSGYERKIEMVGQRRTRAGSRDGSTTFELVEGVAVIVDAIPAPAPGAGYDAHVLAGRPRDVHRLEGVFNPDPWLLIDANAGSHNRLRGHASMAYGTAVHQATSFLDDDGCFELDPYSVGGALSTVPLCQARGVVYTRQQRAWEGWSGVSSQHVKSGSTVLAVDELGRPTTVLLEGDMYTANDDVCLVIKYARPSGGAPPGATVVHGMWMMSHCTGDREFQTLLGGVRHEHDHIAETPGPGASPDQRTVGWFTHGMPTRRIVERYDAQTGELLDEFVAEETFYHGNPYGLPGRVVRTRQRGSAASRTVDYRYDDFGVSLISTTESASDTAASLTRSYSLSVLPWRPAVVTEPNGEASVTSFDMLGRPARSAVRVGGAEHVLSEVVYDDDPAGRAVTTREYPDFGAGEPTEATTYFDALGRVRFSQRQLGADYGGRTLIGDLVSYDELGRVAFAADPFESAESPLSPASLTEPRYGTSYWYETGGKLRGTVRGPGHLPLMPYTIESSTEYPGGVFPTLYSYEYSGYRAIVSRQGPSERTVGSPQFGARDEWRYDGGGRLVYEARLANTERIELATYGYDRLDHRVLVRRYRDPAGGTQPLDWTMAYDSLGQLLRVTEPGTSTKHHEYDEWGGVIESTWTDGGRLRISRNRFDGFARSTDSWLASRLVGSTSETTEWRARYFYDAHSGDQHHVDGTHLLGRLSHAQVDGVMEAFYGYDPLGRTGAVSRVSATDPESRRFTVRYDHAAGGALRQIEYDLPGIQEAVSYEYDSAERISRVVFDDGAGSWPLFDATEIDDLGRYRAVLLGNGVREEYDYADHGRRELRHHAIRASGERTDRYFDRYDGDGRLLKERQRVTPIADGPSLPPPVRHLTHTYDASGRLDRSHRMTELGGGGIFTTTRDERFDHDPLGNVTSRRDETSSGAPLLLSFSSSDRDRVHETAACSSWQERCRTGYRYDGAGNTTELRSSGMFPPPLGPPAITTHLAYDGASRVVGVSRDGRQANLAYGAFGELAELSVSGWGMQQRRERHYGDLVREAYFPLAGDHLIERTIPGPLGVIAAVRGTGDDTTLVYHHGDAAANRLFTGSDGQVVQRLDYDAFGLVLEDTGIEGAIDYTYRQWNFGESLEEFGIVLLGARVYHPETGRFLQRDPLMLDVGASRANPYSFSFSDPVNFTDTTGLSPVGFCMSGAQTHCALFSNSNPTSSQVAETMAAFGVGFVLDFFSYVRANSPRRPAWHKRAWSSLSKHVFPRVEGGFKVATGTVGALFGAGLCATGVGCAIGGPIILVSLDYAGSGLPQLVTGYPQTTVIGQLAGERAQQIQEDLVTGAAFAAPFARALQLRLGPPANPPSSTGPSAAGGAGRVTRGADVTDEAIRAAMRDAPLLTDQGAVSVPAIRRYVDRLAKGDTPPPIRVDKGVIVDGNHRYIAGRLFGKEPPQVPATRPAHRANQPGRSWDDMKLDQADWGNR